MLGYDSENDLLTHVTDVARDLPMEPGDRTIFRESWMRREPFAITRSDAAARTKPASGCRRRPATFDGEGSIAFIDGFVQDIGERKRLDSG